MKDTKEMKTRYTTITEGKDRYGDDIIKRELRLNAMARDIMLGILAIVVLVGSMYTVEEGHVGVVKRFSEAKYQVEPGLHFKIPLADSVEVMEVRTRKNLEENIPVATAEQMPSHASVSVNWTVNRVEAIDIFKQLSVPFGLTSWYLNWLMCLRLLRSLFDYPFLINQIL